MIAAVHHPKKIAILSSGNIGMELFGILRSQYPTDQIVVWNRADSDSDSRIAAAISGDQAQSIKRRLRRGASPDSNSFEFTTDLESALRDADIVAITGGKPRTSPTQSRAMLAVDNKDYIDPIANAVKKLAGENPQKEVTYFIGTNPVGLIDHRFQQVSGVPHNRVVGLGGELDVERLRQSIRLNLHVGYDDIRGERVLGEHGKMMVVPWDQIEICGKEGNWRKLLDMPEIKENNGALLKEFMDATVEGGGKFTTWTEDKKRGKKGQSDHRGPAAALAYMIEQLYDARWGNQNNALPITASTHLEKHDIYSGQTIKFNKDGSYSFAPTPPLSDKENKDLHDSWVASVDARKQFDAGRSNPSLALV